MPSMVVRSPWQESICGSLEVAKRFMVHIDPFQQNVVQYFFHSQLKTIFTLSNFT